MIGPYKTGLALIDDHFGGFPPGKAYLVFGEPGSGKSLIGLQVAQGGARAGEAVLYLTMERPSDLMALASGLHLDVSSAVDAGDIVFLEYDRDVTSRVLRYGWKPFLEQLGRVRASHPIRRVVFDPIHPLFAGTTEEGRLRYDLRYLVESLEEWGWMGLFLNDRGTMQGHPSLYRVFSEICCGIFELQDEVENLGASKYLFVHKLQQPSDGARRIPFEIVPGRGLHERNGAAASREADVASRETRERGPRPRPPFPIGSLRPQGHADGGDSNPERPKILIADGDPFVRSLLKKGLRGEFDVVLAEDGVEALALILREHPDVLVLDVDLGGIRGFEICRSLRSTGFSEPILFVSTENEPNERVRGLSLGANDFITKPFALAEVVQRVRNASRTRMTIDAHSGDWPDLDALLRAARSRALPPEEFQVQLDNACHNVEAFAAPLGIVRIRWDARNASSSQVRTLKEQIEHNTRPEDLLTFLGNCEAAVVLNTEDEDGTLAYIRKLRRLWQSSDGARLDLPPDIAVAYGTIRSVPASGLSAIEALRLAAGPPRRFFDDPLFETPPGDAFPTPGVAAADGTTGQASRP